MPDNRNRKRPIQVKFFVDEKEQALIKKKTVSKSFYNFFLGRSQAVGKACVCHHSTIIPPSGKLLRIGNLGLTDG